MSEDSNCYKFGLISTLRTYEKKRIRHRDISKTVLEKDLINLGTQGTWKKYLEIVEHNLKIVKFTLNNLPPQIVHSRITSDLLPLSTLKSFDLGKMNYELVLKEKNFLHFCQEIKEILEKRKITVSMHSSQFLSLASDDKTIRENSQAELIYYANILSLIAKESIITIHLNSKREMVEQLGEEKYLQWVAEAVQTLPANVLAKISPKNEARGFWNSANLYKFHRYCQEKYRIFLPLSWDNAHELANPSEISKNRENWECFSDTWKNQTPLFYWSESCGQNKLAHCDFFHRKTLPPSSIPIWVCETKMKELSLRELLESQKINIEEAMGKKER